jgi:hypothetical protein
MIAAEVEDEGVGIALEDQTQVAPAATFHEWGNSPQTYARVQVRVSISGLRR